MTRRESREEALSLIFEQDFDLDRTEEEILDAAMEIREEKISKFAKELFLKTNENRGDIDEKIARAAENWKFERIGKVTLAILRLAGCEIDFFPEIPVEITVNEALELTRKFDDEKSVGFVNGVLGNYAKGVEKPLAKKKAETEENAEEE